MASQVEIKGKSYLITGAASGLGALYAKTFLKEGAQHVAILDVAVEKGKTLAEELNRTYPGKVTFIKCDVSDEDNVVSAFQAVIDEVKQLDVIINNAGITYMNDSEKAWKLACDVNWRGLVSMTYKGVKHMRKDHGGAGGTIINVSSGAGFFIAPTLPAYNGSKAAVLHFSQSLAVDPFYERTGIRILTVCFGATDTPLLLGLDDRVWDPALSQDLVQIIGNMPTQKAESAAQAVVTMFKTGANGSIWLSHNDEPARDITAIINKAYSDMTSVLL